MRTRLSPASRTAAGARPPDEHTTERHCGLGRPHPGSLQKHRTTSTSVRRLSVFPGSVTPALSSTSLRGEPSLHPSATLAPPVPAQLQAPHTLPTSGPPSRVFPPGSFHHDLHRELPSVHASWFRVFVRGPSVGLYSGSPLRTPPLGQRGPRHPPSKQLRSLPSRADCAATDPASPPCRAPPAWPCRPPPHHCRPELTGGHGGGTVGTELLRPHPSLHLTPAPAALPGDSPPLAAHQCPASFLRLL